MTIPQAFPNRTTLERLAAPSFEALFSYGFRPFFLGAAVYAVLLMSVWLAWVITAGAGNGPQWLPIAGSPYAWHAHEMVFGFAVAAVAGFLLTAVPNWTGTLPLSGAPLVALFFVWVAGRATMFVSGLLPQWLSATVDVLFLPFLGAMAARQLFVKPAARNLVFLVLLAALMACNIAYHLSIFEILKHDPLTIMRTALLMMAVMIAIIGGRIIPAFTHNWLHLHDAAGPMPRRIGWLDATSIGAVVAYALLQAVSAPELLVGLAALAAVALNLSRLALWCGWKARSEPIVWVLHLGYAWMIVGLLLGAASALTAAIPIAAVSHAIGTGAVGTMIVGVMSRASLGHTGRPIKASRSIVTAYVLVSVAALLRAFGPLVAPQFVSVEYGLAGLAWIAAFAVFAVAYAPILTTPRVHTKVLST